MWREVRSWQPQTPLRHTKSSKYVEIYYYRYRFFLKEITTNKKYFMCSWQAQVYVLKQAEGGRHTPFFNNYRYVRIFHLVYLYFFIYTYIHTGREKKWWLVFLKMESHYMKLFLIWKFYYLIFLHLSLWVCLCFFWTLF